MSKLDQINQILEIEGRIQKIDQGIKLMNAKQEGFKQGFRQAAHLYGKHDNIIDVGDEDHVDMVCIECQEII